MWVIFCGFSEHVSKCGGTRVRRGVRMCPFGQVCWRSEQHTSQLLEGMRRGVLMRMCNFVFLCVRAGALCHQGRELVRHAVHVRQPHPPLEAPPLEGAGVAAGLAQAARIPPMVPQPCTLPRRATARANTGARLHMQSWSVAFERL